MSNDKIQKHTGKEYDLAERTAQFSENLITFLKTLSRDTINRPLVYQATKSGTSIGANYMEADVAESKRDFVHKIGISRKEAKETMYWMRVIARANQDKKQECRYFYQEAEEFVKIFSTIISNTKLNS
ncbi:four helix bundle protein [Candidatus Wolfebacteria bacterium]|nr:four helix bundle protein [Candidatus Wolfebacteria bacterium]